MNCYPLGKLLARAAHARQAKIAFKAKRAASAAAATETRKRRKTEADSSEPAPPTPATITVPQRRLSSGIPLPPRKRYMDKPSSADETGATLDDEPTTAPSDDDETSPLE